jgi:hypothetical protein
LIDIICPEKKIEDMFFFLLFFLAKQLSLYLGILSRQYLKDAEIIQDRNNCSSGIHLSSL